MSCGSNKIIYFLESSNSASEENDFCETLLGDKESIEIEYVVVPGVGRTADYTGLDVNGKIALVRRGSNTFEEKALIAQQQGAAGIIIYNNVSGDIKMNVGDATLPVVSISQDDGEVLAKDLRICSYTDKQIASANAYYDNLEKGKIVAVDTPENLEKKVVKDNAVYVVPETVY